MLIPGVQPHAAFTTLILTYQTAFRRAVYHISGRSENWGAIECFLTIETLSKGVNGADYPRAPWTGIERRAVSFEQYPYELDVLPRQ